MPLYLPEFERKVPLVEDNRCATFTFHRWWLAVTQALKESFNRLETIVLDIQAAQQAAADAQAAAVVAQSAADTAAAEAAAAATEAQAAAASATTANSAITQIQEGTLEIEAIKIGGQRFINSGGSLVAEA